MKKEKTSKLNKKDLTGFTLLNFIYTRFTLLNNIYTRFTLLKSIYTGHEKNKTNKIAILIAIFGVIGLGFLGVEKAQSADRIFYEDFEDGNLDTVPFGSAQIEYDNGVSIHQESQVGVHHDFLDSGAGKSGLALSTLTVNWYPEVRWSIPQGSWSSNEFYVSYKKRYVNWSGPNEVSGEANLKNFYNYFYPDGYVGFALLNPPATYSSCQDGSGNYCGGTVGWDRWSGMAVVDLLDGNWHEYTMYVNMATGTRRVWLDEILQADATIGFQGWTGVQEFNINSIDAGNGDMLACATGNNGCYDRVLLDDIEIWDGLPTATPCSNYNNQTECEANGCNYCEGTCQTESCPITIRADVNQDSQINTTDAQLTLRNSLGLDMTSTNWQTSSTTGDVNCDLTSNSTDAMLIIRHSLGLSMVGSGWCE